MREEEYSRWLQSQVTNAVVTNYIKRCKRVEDNLNVDLDHEFKKDNGESLLEKLSYTTDDLLHNRPLRCDIYFNAGSDLRNGIASLKTAVSKYFVFCGNDRKPANMTYDNSVDNGKQYNAPVRDSYQEFLNHFAIDRQEFFKWGVSSTIFPAIVNVESEWNSLKERILSNKRVYIRGYGRDAHGTQLYKDLYKELFNHSHVEKDPTNNAEPHKLIQRLTGLKRNCNVYNYQVSHIWGRTKNIFMFEAPWNICYTPKMMDPFTGHETQGLWPIEYQKLFISKAYELYTPFIDEYNQILKEFDIENRVRKYIFSLRGTVPDKELAQFAKDVTAELSPVLYE